MSNEEKKNNISKLSSNNILDNQAILKQSTNSNIENIDKSYFSYEELFTINDIKEINESANPKGTISKIIEKF